MLLVAIAPLVIRAQVQPQRDECDLRAPGVCARHVLQDEGAILTSPLHARASDLLWIAPFGLATGVAIDYDAHAMRTLGYHPKQQNTFDQISNVGAVYLPIAAIAGGYAAGAWRKDDYLQQTAVLSAEAILDAQIINLPLKYAINRQTPDPGRWDWPLLAAWHPKTWPDGQSMPSGHSLTAWSMAHVVAARYPGWGTRLAAYGVATAVSASRVMARQHFPSDVVVGSTLGYLIGGYVVHKRGEVEQGLLILHGGHAERTRYAVVLQLRPLPENAGRASSAVRVRSMSVVSSALRRRMPSTTCAGALARKASLPSWRSLFSFSFSSFASSLVRRSRSALRRAASRRRRRHRRWV